MAVFGSFNTRFFSRLSRLARESILKYSFSCLLFFLLPVVMGFS